MQLEQPTIIQSDNGSEFINRLVEDLFDELGIEHILSSVGHPRTNGAI
jgi:transposase InsO family protein